MIRNIILAGGTGERIKSLTGGIPKQFYKLYSEKTMLEETIIRNSFINSQTIILNKDFSHIDGDKIIEPSKKGTTAAIAMACLKYINDEIFVVTPSDHRISGDYEKTIKHAIDVSFDDKICLIGIKPTGPDTRYGWIGDGMFKEKPSKDMAKKYMDDGYLWNSGIVVFKPRLFLEELHIHNKRLYYDCIFAYSDDGIIEDRWNLIDGKSVDYEILEKTDKLYTCKADFVWDDMGSMDKRRWGEYFILDDGDEYLTKRLEILPGEGISLQYHNKRGENWQIVKGEGVITLNSNTFMVNKGFNCVIRPGDIHQIVNIGDDKLIIIETQYGEYIGEDDIVRLEHEK